MRSGGPPEKVVCDRIPFTAKGQTPVASGEYYVWRRGGDNRPYPLGVCRLKVLSPDSVECTRLWEENTKGKGECSPMVYRGVVYDGAQAWELATGKELPTARMGLSWNSPSLAGDYIVGADGSRVGAARTAGKVNDNVLEDDLATVDPEWDRKPYCGQCKPRGHSSWYAAGNRLFFRTAGHLWCFGDPKVPFAAPKDCPAAARCR